MITKTRARTKAASIKTSVDAVHAKIAALPDTPERAELVEEFDRLHRKLNGVARLASEVFEAPIEDFSGGTDRPDEE